MPSSPMDLTGILVAASLAAIAFPIGFLIALDLAARRQRRDGTAGLRLPRGVALLGGLALGSMALIGMDDPELWLPFGLAAAFLAFRELRAGRRNTAGWLICGVALPWSVAWGTFDAVAIDQLALPDRLGVWAAFSAATIVALGGVAIAARATAERRPPARRFRSFRTMAVALGEPNRVGPFSLPAVNAVVAIVVTSLLAPLIGAALGAAWWVGTIATIVLGALLGTEAYLRALQPRSRRAMEAFMWLGQQSHAAARSASGGGIPTTRAGAAAWLRRRPPRDDDPAELQGLRVDVLLLAGRIAEARAAAEALPTATPDERFAHAAARDLVDWWSGGPGHVAAMVEAANAIAPEGGRRLRASVAVAAAQVRHRAGSVAVPSDVNAAVGAGREGDARTNLEGSAALAPPAQPGSAGTDADALGPLLAARDELGALADGRLRRILWPRIFAAFLVAGLVLTGLFLVTGQLL